MSTATRRLLSILDRAGPHYLGFILSGISGLAWAPSALKTVTLTSVAVYFCLGGLAIGGALCVIGRWSHQVGYKILGLILLLVALFSYMVPLIAFFPGSLASFFLLLSLGSLLGYRLRTARRTRDAHRALRRGDISGPDLAAYARDSLARRRHYRRWNRGGSLAERQDDQEAALRDYEEPQSTAPRYPSARPPRACDDRGDGESKR